MVAAAAVVAGAVVGVAVVAGVLEVVAAGLPGGAEVMDSLAEDGGAVAAGAVATVVEVDDVVESRSARAEPFPQAALRLAGNTSATRHAAALRLADGHTLVGALMAASSDRGVPRSLTI